MSTLQGWAERPPRPEAMSTLLGWAEVGWVGPSLSLSYLILLSCSVIAMVIAIGIIIVIAIFVAPLKKQYPSKPNLFFYLCCPTSIVQGRPFVRPCSTSSVQGHPKADFCLWFRPPDRPCPTSSVQGRPSFL